MKKFDWNEPITWKGYCELCFISFIFGIIYLIWVFRKVLRIPDIITMVVDKISNIFVEWVFGDSKK